MDNAYLILEDGTDMEAFDCLLMFKDFDAHGFKTDWQLMTNADTPYLAVKDLIDNPVNPFTNKEINDDMKKQDYLHIFMSDNYFVHINNGKQFIPGKWLYVHDNLFDTSNWLEEK